MSIIKFKLVKFEKAAAFQILEMDERYICKTRGSPLRFKSKNGCLVTSYCRVSLENNKVYLRGTNRTVDFTVATRSFLSNKERDLYCKMIVNAIGDWAENNNWYKDTGKVINSTDTDTVYEF